MGRPVISLYIMNIIGCNHFDIKFLGQFKKLGNQLCLFLNSMVVELNEIILLSENINHLPHRFFRLTIFSVKN